MQFNDVVQIFIIRKENYNNVEISNRGVHLQGSRIKSPRKKSNHKNPPGKNPLGQKSLRQNPPVTKWGKYPGTIYIPFKRMNGTLDSQEDQYQECLSQNFLILDQSSYYIAYMYSIQDFCEAN